MYIIYKCIPLKRIRESTVGQGSSRLTPSTNDLTGDPRFGVPVLIPREGRRPGLLLRWNEGSGELRTCRFMYIIYFYILYTYIYIYMCLNDIMCFYAGVSF